MDRPVVVVIIGFIWHLRPRTLLNAAAASVAVAVVIGSPGFRDNLELPLSYTIVGMPLALIAWMLMNGQPRAWHAPLIVGLTLIAIGFKEQGLVLVPVAVVCWWTRAPGATRGLAATLAALAVAYVLFRLQWRSDWPIFEQAVGLGFRELEVPEATERFGAFPYWIYAYNAAGTIANALFAEPGRGVFRIVQAWSEGRAQAWQFVHVGSSIGLTGAIAWSGSVASGRTQPRMVAGVTGLCSGGRRPARVRRPQLQLFARTPRRHGRRVLRHRGVFRPPRGGGIGTGGPAHAIRGYRPGATGAQRRVADTGAGDKYARATAGEAIWSGS